MNGIKRNRTRLRQRQRMALLAMMLSTTTTSVVAETRINPYFQQASHRNHPARPAADRQNDVSPFETVDFGAVNEFVAESRPSSIRETNVAGQMTDQTLAPKQIPRRLPRVGKGSVSASVDPVREVQTSLAASQNHSQMFVPSQGDSALGVPTSRPLTPDLSNSVVPPVPDLVFNNSDSRLIAAAARRQATLSSSSQTTTPPVAGRWLQSITSDSCDDRAAEHLDDAYREYSVGAWASAEASAWKAMELVATGIDISRRPNSALAATPTVAANWAAANPIAGTGQQASEALQIARTAMSEACDFVASGAAVDGDLLRGIASSHQTFVLSAGVPDGMTATEAVDRYLDHARLHLAPIASTSVQAAQAMDLLAAIHLGRDEAKWIPEETSLCLRRAALQGQPSNASLASRLGMQLAAMGLDEEADGILRHAMTLNPSDDVARALASVWERRGDRMAAQRLLATSGAGGKNGPGPNRTPDVIQLSPAQFASISPALNVATATPTSPQGSAMAVTAGGPAQSASQRPAVTKTPAAGESTAAPRKRGSRFIPASLAGFRMPFSGARTVTPPSQQTDPSMTVVPAVDTVVDSIEINLEHDGIYDADEFRTHADSVNDGRTPASSPIKRFLNKVPKLW